MLSAPGGRAFETIRPRAALPPESKRVERVIKNEHDLAGQLGELELSTRERNKAFEEQLQAIEERAKNFQIKLSAERCAMEEQNKVQAPVHLDSLILLLPVDGNVDQITDAQAIMTSLQQRLDAVTKSIEASVEDKISQQYLAPLEVETQRLVAEEAKVEDVSGIVWFCLYHPLAGIRSNIRCLVYFECCAPHPRRPVRVHYEATSEGLRDF